MSWKIKKRIFVSDGETIETQPTTIPFIINTSQEVTQSTVGIRVVENKIFFYGEIDDQSCLELNRILIEVDTKLQSTKNMLGDEYTPIIHLHLNTPGGSIYAAFSTVDTIRQLKSKVYTYVDGICASAGTLISSIGSKRLMGKHAHLLIHQLSSESYGTYADMQADIENCTNLMKILKEFYKKHTKIPMKKLDELMTKDIYLTSDDCIRHGIIDQIL